MKREAEQRADTGVAPPATVSDAVEPQWIGLPRGGLLLTTHVNKPLQRSVTYSEKPAQIFFGYASRPASRRAILGSAAAQIGRMAGLNTRTWEQFEGASGFIIDEVLNEIDAADVVVFDATDLNENVMFELGYAIGSRRPVWLVRDPSFSDADHKWKQMRTLTTVRYVPYTNSDDIRIAFLTERPDIRRHVIFDENIGATLQPEREPSLFYLRSFYDPDPARMITRRVHSEEDRGIRVIEADPRESSFEALAWYAQQIYVASAVVVHFDDPGRKEALVHNSRLALVSGLARGMGKPLLMLAQEEYLTPIDYRDLLFVYRSAQLASSKTDAWLQEQLMASYDRIQELDRRTSRLRLATELKSLRLGEHVAENESDVLAEYFVRTAPYEDVLRSRTTVFVGRKGTGKSANALEAAGELGRDRRNLVCLIKPYAYELAAVTTLLEKYRQRDQKGFVIESLWKFLLYTEMALAAYREFEQRPLEVGLTDEAKSLGEFLDEAEFLTLDFAVRLERTIEELLGLPENTGVSDTRVAISESLHGKLIGELRRRLVAALRDKIRIAVLIDNLDRAWERGPDARPMAEFFLGLITAAEQIEAEVKREAGKREPLLVTAAIFVRSDIYSEIASVASEPDKIPLARINWADAELRLQVLEERYVATREGAALPDELWDRYFCSTVRGVPTSRYLTWRTLPRPRDIVFIANKSIIAAINHRNPKVEERDVIAAELEYAQFALEALEVEAVGFKVPLTELLFEFIGSEPTLEAAQVREVLTGIGLEDQTADVITYLRSLSFLGVQVGEREFAYAEDPMDLAKSDVLARRKLPGRDARYAVHPAFRPYLEIEDADLPPGQLAFE